MLPAPAKQGKQPKQKPSKAANIQHDLSSLVVAIQEYQRRRSYQEHNIERLQRSVLDKYERVANIKRRMQYYESWHDISNVSAAYPMELTDCYKLSTSASSFEALKIITLAEDHLIHQFVRKLRESDLACTVIHNFQCFPSKFQSIESLIINAYIQSLYPSHSQLFDCVIQPLFIELIESLKKTDEEIASAQIMDSLYRMLDLRHFHTYFGQDLSTDIRPEHEHKESMDELDERQGKFVLKLMYALIHHRITNVMFAPLQKIITKIARGDLIFNIQNTSNLYDLCSLCVDAIYQCDYSALLDIFATIFDCLHFSVLELSHAECIQIINYIIWRWIIFVVISEPHRFGFRISYLTKWQQASSAVFIEVMHDVLMGKSGLDGKNKDNKNANDSNEDETERKDDQQQRMNNVPEYELDDKQMQVLQGKVSQNVASFAQQLQKFVAFQAQSQAQTASSSENVSTYNHIHEHNFGILHNWSIISSIELQVLHAILFSDSSNLSSSQIRSLEKFHKLTFDTLDQTREQTPAKSASPDLNDQESSIALHSAANTAKHSEESSELDSLDVLARTLSDTILNTQFRNSYMFIVGVYPHSDIYKQWQFRPAAKLIETSPLEHLSKICKKNIHYLSKIQVHIKKAPHIFATWCHSLLKLLLNINNPVPRNMMINTGALMSDSGFMINDLNTAPNEEVQPPAPNELDLILGYLEHRDVRNPSLLYGLSSKNSTKSADIASIYFGFKELENIYPSASIHWNSIIQWLSLCLTEATKTCDAWHEGCIKSLHRVLVQLSDIDRIYRARIDHIKHCLFSTKIHYFSLYTHISFHQAIPIPNVIFNDDGVVEEKSKYIFDFFCDSIASFLDKVLLSLPHLSKLPKAIPVLLKKYINVISRSHEMKDYSPHSTLDQGMLRAIHHIICIAMYYILNEPLWILDQQLNQALEILSNGEPLNPYKDLGLNTNITISSELWKWIGNQLHCLEFHITPTTKMQCIHEIMQTLTHHLHSHLRWQKSVQHNEILLQSTSLHSRASKLKGDKRENIPVGADDIFPSLIWLIIQTQPKRLSSSLSLIEHVSESPTSGVHAYSFTLFKQAISYIQQIANEKATKLDDD